ncbi:hypothetical protein BDV96DRAFT_648362 [Lophiotrema nucula]|uniref:Uncharacterized protein n=1 Tax=Lophiotrema nucula TaxID=690887 RepID=A0A6A5Z4P9_9PLEO|nr:hypothetical protein BDV96DRAFT_648362 [Lophiotrema nucula]
MQLINLAAAAALVATAAAATDFANDPNQYNGNATCDESSSKRVRVFNRCSYPVYLWSVLKGQGCPASDAAVIEPGSYYAENYRNPYQGAGVSLKLSKDDQCKGVDIAQLEYYIDSSATYGANYLDMSYVDCGGQDCPTAQEGYYLKSGNVDGEWAANDVNEICPVLSCSGWETCAKCSYVLPDDRQTKSCNVDAPLDLYMCGSEAPGEESSQPSAAPSSSKVKSSSAPKSTSTSKSTSSTEPSSSSEAYVQAAAVTTPAPKAAPVNTKVEVVYEYVTKVEYVNAKRHLHGHRHQHFRA